MTNKIEITHEPKGDNFFISSQIQEPETSLSILVKIISRQVIADAKKRVVAPIEIWNEVEKFWEKEKKESLGIKIRHDERAEINN